KFEPGSNEAALKAAALSTGVASRGGSGSGRGRRPGLGSGVGSGRKLGPGSGSGRRTTSPVRPDDTASDRARQETVKGIGRDTAENRIPGSGSGKSSQPRLPVARALDSDKRDASVFAG